MKKFQSAIFTALLAVIIYNIVFLVNRFVYPVSDSVWIFIGVAAIVLLVIAVVQVFVKSKKEQK